MKRLLYFPAGDQSYPLSLLTVGGSNVQTDTDLGGQEEKKLKYKFYFKPPPIPSHGFLPDLPSLNMQILYDQNLSD